MSLDLYNWIFDKVFKASGDHIRAIVRPEIHRWAGKATQTSTNAPVIVQEYTNTDRQTMVVSYRDVGVYSFAHPAMTANTQCRHFGGGNQRCAVAMAMEENADDPENPYYECLVRTFDLGDSLSPANTLLTADVFEFYFEA